MIILAGAIIISLNNAGIIGKANEAVEKNNVNQVQTLAELKWADAYLENRKDLNGLKEKVLSELKQELGEDELAKYDIKFTGNGVKVRVYEDTSIPEDATEKLGAYGKFKYVILSNGDIQITKYLGTATDIVIPAEYDGYAVYAVGNNETNIAEGKYYNIFGNKDTEINNTITSIKISRGIREIRDVAFEYCMGLTGELDIPDTIESIGAFAFNACSYTGNLKIPNSVTTIGEWAFYNCSKLSGTVTTAGRTIDVTAFNGCPNITKI